VADSTHWSPNCDSRDGTPVIWLAVHTAEGATTAASLSNFLADPNSQVSYHAVCDDDTTIQCVDYDSEAWAMLGGNCRSDQICCTGFAAWSTVEWMSHQGMLDRIAAWLVERSAARGAPLSHIGPDGVSSRAKGIIGHHDYTIGAADGSHTDPGPNFPWDYVINRARALAAIGTACGRELNAMESLPATAPPKDPNSDPKTWPQRNYDVVFDGAGGAMGDCYICFGGQDWSGRTKDTIRSFLSLASWMLPKGVLSPVDPVFTGAGGGRPVPAHNVLGPWKAPPGAVGITLNGAWPGEGYVSVGRSG
jgi:hypothetical protein